jgi:hypothetical protein
MFEPVNRPGSSAKESIKRMDLLDLACNTQTQLRLPNTPSAIIGSFQIILASSRL